MQENINGYIIEVLNTEFILYEEKKMFTVNCSTKRFAL